MARMVLLEHATPDGASHFDWMLARNGEVGDDDRSLVTFRVDARVDRLTQDAVEGVRLPDHRGRYLWFEGDIGEGRGAVRRVAEGECVVERDGPGVVEATGRWTGGRAFTLRASIVCGGSETGGDAWLLEIAPCG